MSDIYFVVLAIEVEADDPGVWDWPTLIDNPLPVDLIASVQTDTNESTEANLNHLASVIRGEANLYARGEYEW